MKQIFFSFLIVLTINQSEAGKDPGAKIAFQEALKNVDTKREGPITQIIEKCLKAKQNPLHAAVLSQNTEAVEKLCQEHRKYINQKDKDGNTPLNLRRIGFKDYYIYDTEQKHLRAITHRLLLQHGADVNIENNAGTSAISNAFDSFFEWEGDNPKYVGLIDSEIAIANAHLDLGKPDFTQLENCENTLLHCAIARNNLKAAELILKAINKRPKQERETIFNTRRGTDDRSIYDLATYDNTKSEMKHLLNQYFSAHKTLSNV